MTVPVFYETMSRSGALQSFFKDVRKLPLGTIKACYIVLKYMQKDDQKDEYESTFNSAVPRILEIPADDEGLYGYLKTSITSEFPLLASEGVEFLNTHPFRALEVKPFLDRVRQSVAVHNARPFDAFEASIRNLLKKGHLDIPDLETIISRKVIVQFSAPDSSGRRLKLDYISEGASWCNSCDKVETVAQKLLKCSNCKITYYCNRDCQVRDWKIHKLVCTKKSASK